MTYTPVEKFDTFIFKNFILNKNNNNNNNNNNNKNNNKKKKKKKEKEKRKENIKKIKRKINKGAYAQIAVL
jgi:hypothetical protein